MGREMTVDELITKLHKLIEENLKVLDALVIVGSSDNDDIVKAEEVCYEPTYNGYASCEDVVLISGGEGY